MDSFYKKQLERLDSDFLKDNEELEKKCKFINNLDNIDDSQKTRMSEMLNSVKDSFDKSYIENVDKLFKENEAYINSVLDRVCNEAYEYKQIQEKIESVSYRSLEKQKLQATSERIKQEAKEKEVECREFISKETEELKACINVHNEIKRQILNVRDNADKSTLSGRLEDEALFDSVKVGNYTYKSTDYGKIADGALELSDKGVRNQYNQRLVGGDYRRETDDGGHLIGHRFLGSSDFENLVAQDANFNRSAYKRMENEWQRHIESGDKVYVNVETYNREGIERPDVFMGYYIVENPEGKRTWNAFSLMNESREVQKEWDEEDS